MPAPAGSVVETVDLAPLGHGPLDGIDVAVKELFDVAGSRPRSGGRVDLGGPSTGDASAVRLLRRAGGRVVARSASHEFAWGITNRADDGTGTGNPRLPGRVSGGSSGGSAALVAAGTVRLALGTDTAGSVRVPAAFCGVPGWKASNGLVPLDGCVPLAPSLDCGGLLADSLALLQRGAAAFGVAAFGVSAFGVAAPAAPPRSWRVGVLDPDRWALADPERRAHLERSAARFGAEPVRSLPAPAEVFATFAVVQASEARVVHREVLRTWPSAAADYGNAVRARLEAADALDDAVVAAAVRDRATLVEAMTAVWERVDVLLAVLPCGPSRVEAPDTVEVGGVVRPMRDVLLPFTCIANLVGAPAVVVPVAADAEGAPVAVQLMAAPGRDAELLAWAAAHFPG